MVERQGGSEESIDKPGNILTPETLAGRLGAIGQEKDKFLGALHNRIANWGAGFLDYHFGFVWGGFRRLAFRQRGKGRAHFRTYLEETSAEKDAPQLHH